MLGALLTAGKFLGRVVTAKNPQGKTTAPRVAAVVAAGAALVGAVALQLGAAPEMAAAIGHFVEALGMLALGQ